MAENDIYNNKRRYELFVKSIDRLTIKAVKDRYYCKNKDNLTYFKALIKKFNIDDLSYIRRLRLLNVLKFLTDFIKSDLKDIDNKTRDNLIIEIRKKTKPSNLKKTERDIKRIYNILFDGNIPKPITKLKIKVDISTQKARNDKLTYDEFDSIMKYFSNDVVIKSYLSLAFESLGRPQEMLYTKIKDLEIYDKYAYVNISEHGKEGIKKLLSIESFPYLLSMLNQHKNRKNKNSYLFLNEVGKQLTPHAINKKLRITCKKLGIDKAITCYSLKRFGVTFKRLNGSTDVEIQRIAGWRSTKQLQTYDLSDQEDVFKIQLAKAGLIKDEKLKKHYPKTKICDYCNELIGFAESMCPKCKNIIDKDLIKKKIQESDETKRKLDLFEKFYNEHKDQIEKML